MRLRQRVPHLRRGEEVILGETKSDSFKERLRPTHFRRGKVILILGEVKILIMLKKISILDILRISQTFYSECRKLIIRRNKLRSINGT